MGKAAGGLHARLILLGTLVQRPMTNMLEFYQRGVGLCAEVYFLFWFPSVFFFRGMLMGDQR